MKKHDSLFQKMNRDIWIAAVFVLFILLVPVATIVKDVLPEKEESSLEEEEAVLNGNGTMINRNTETDAQTDAASEAGVQTVSEPWFTTVQNQVNGFTERLFLRDELILFNTDLTAALTGNSYIESTQVLLGKNNWLFYKTEGDGHPLSDYMGTNHFTEEELSGIAANLTAARDYFENELGIRFVPMWLPNKENVYQEYMPDTIPKVYEDSRADQLAVYLSANTDLTYVYPMDAFLSAKEDYQIYYRTDTHWNQIGAFVGLQAFFQEVYGNSAGPDSVEFIVSGTDYSGDLASIAGIADDYSIDTQYVFDITTMDPAQYRDEVLLIVGDSFGGFLSAVANPYYREVYVVRTEEFTMSMIEEYQPDIVIWESVERYLETFFLNENLLTK